MSNSETSIPHKIVDTLLTANIIAKDFSTYVDAFSPMRSDWTAEYAGQLIQRTDDALSNLVGVDHRGELRKSTDRVRKIMDQAKADLREESCSALHPMPPPDEKAEVFLCILLVVSFFQRLDWESFREDGESSE